MGNTGEEVEHDTHLKYFSARSAFGTSRCNHGRYFGCLGRCCFWSRNSWRPSTSLSTPCPMTSLRCGSSVASPTVRFGMNRTPNGDQTANDVPIRCTSCCCSAVCGDRLPPVAPPPSSTVSIVVDTSSEPNSRNRQMSEICSRNRPHRNSRTSGSFRLAPGDIRVFWFRVPTKPAPPSLALALPHDARTGEDAMGVWAIRMFHPPWGVGWNSA